MLAQIQRVTDTTVAAADIVVFEAAALSTRPLTKLGSIYHGARPTREMLLEMAQAVRSGAESIPLHTLHQQGGELPIGRVFDAQLVDNADGSTELMAKFYLPASETELLSKIDLAVLDEVSVGVKAKQALCSQCGFDYFAQDSDPMHLWEQTCPEGHTIGQGGTHLTLVGLDNWMELSLVSRGASSRPKIRSRVRDAMPQATYDRLAASGKPIEALMLFAQPSMEINEPMDAEAKAALEAMSAKLDGIVARLDELETPAPQPQPEPEPEPEPEVNAELEQLRLQLEEAQAKIQELETPKAPENIELPQGGVAASAINDAKPQEYVLNAAAFKTVKPKRQ